MKRAAACILFRTRLLIFWQTLNVSEATLCPGNHLALLEAAFSLLGGCSYKMPASQPFQRLQVNKKVGVREFKCGCLGECKWQNLETGFHCLPASSPQQHISSPNVSVHSLLPKTFKKKQGNFQVVSPCWRFARSWGSLEVCVCFELLADWWLVCWAEEAGGWCATHQASRWPAATARTRLCWGNNAKDVAGFNVVEIVKVEFNANLGLLLSWWPPKLSLATYV